MVAGKQVAARRIVERKAFSVFEFCAAMGISRPMLYKLWKQGCGPAFIQMGRRRLIPTTAADAWIESNLANVATK